MDEEKGGRASLNAYKKTGPIPKSIGISPELTRIQRPFVCHCESAKGGRGNLKL
jgi:hypothetical protein